MSRWSDPERLAAWRRRLKRFSTSGLAVARFCARERVSVASFYYWRKRVGPQATAASTATARGRGAPVRGEAFQPVAVVPAGGDISIRLPGGTRIEVRAARLDAVRAVIAEVVRVDRGAELGPGEPGPLGGSRTSRRLETPREVWGATSC